MLRPATILRLLSAPSRTLLTVAAILGLAVFVFGLRVNALLVRGHIPDERDRYYLPPPGYLRVMTLGYREAAAQLVWIAAIQHAADRRYYDGRRSPWLEQYLDTIVALNPYLLKMYLWADGTLTYGRGRLDNRNWWVSIRFLREGHRRFPRNWEILFKLGCAFTELRSADPRQRSRYLRIAADYLWKAHHVGGGPPWLGSLAARYWSDEGQWMLAYRRALEEFTVTDDPAIKREMASRIADLLGRDAGGKTLVEHFARLGIAPLGNPALVAVAVASDALYHERVLREASSKVQEVAAHKERFDARHQACLPFGSSDLFALLGDCAPGADASELPEASHAGATRDATP